MQSEINNLLIYYRVRTAQPATSEYLVRPEEFESTAPKVKAS